MRIHGVMEGQPIDFEDLQPSWAQPPGPLLGADLSARGMTQADLAARSRLSPKHVNQLIKGLVPLSADVAVALERCLGVPGELWLRAEADWQANRVRGATTAALADRIDWLSHFDLQLLVQRKVISQASSSEASIDELLRFFGVVDTAAFDDVWLQPQASYRRSQHWTVDPYATAVWLRLAEREATVQLDGLQEYDPKLLRAAARELPALTQRPLRDGFEQAQSRLRSAGVILVYLPEVKGTRIQGASKWLAGRTPVITMTGRGKRLDTFWFYMLHEIAHVLLHPKRATYVDLERNTVDDNGDDLESAADAFARDVLVPKNLTARIIRARTHAELRGLAREAGVAADIVAGQRGYLTKDWPLVHRLRPSIDIDAELGQP